MYKIIRKSPKILPNEGYPLPIPKERAWIVWIEDDSGRIEDLEIYDVGYKDSSKWESVKFRLQECIKNRSYNGCGCCFSDWDKWTLKDLFFKFGFQETYISEEVKLYTFNCLGYIEEFEKEVVEYSLFFNSMYIPSYNFTKDSS